MRTEETIVNIIFDAGRGSVAQESREGTCGSPFGPLPTPVRSGYRFDGWYSGDECVTSDTVLESDTDVRLVAHWSRAKATGRMSSFKRQRLAVIVLAVCAVLLAVTWAIVSELISVYTLKDTYVKDGVEYTDEYLIKREDGAYKLFDKDGNRMPTNGVSAQVFIADRGSGNQYRIDPDTAEYKLVATVDPVDGEGVEGTTLLLFPQIQSSYIFSLKVTHADGDSYRFVRGTNGLQLEGFEDVPITFDDQLFAKLCLAAGWTASTRKLTAASDVALLEDGKTIDYAVYGLDDPDTVYTISSVLFKKDANGNTVYQNNAPVADYAVTTDEDGETIKKLQADPNRTYTIKIGDLTPSKTGYYVQLEGSSAVYVLSATYISETLVKPIEELVTPMALHQISVNAHSMVENFLLCYLDEWSEEGIKNSDVIVYFTFDPLDQRRNTMYTTRPYHSPDDSLMAGYEINDTAAANALSSLYGIEYIRCVKLGKITNSLLAEYGLDQDIYSLSYSVQVSYNEGKNEVLISREKNENGNYYVASIPYQMIVEVSPSHLSFLENTASEWYDERFLGQSISYINKLEYTHNGKTYDFTLDNSLSYCFYRYRTQNENGQTVTAFAAVDPANGYLEKQGDKIVYKSNTGITFETVVVDLANTTVLSYRDAMLNPQQSNVIYTEVKYYYYDQSSGQNVTVTPNFKTTDIVYEDSRLYYVDEAKGIKVRVSRQLGEAIYRYEPGYEAIIMVNSDFMSVTLNDKLLDYTIDISKKDDTGVIQTETLSSLENFRNFFIQLITFSLEGDVDEKEFAAWSGMSVEEFLAAKPAADAELIIEAEDHASILNGYTVFNKEGEEHLYYEENLEKNLLIRFYKYSDWKALVTIQTFELDENGNRVYSDAKEIGKFFVNANYLQVLQDSIEKLYNEEAVPTKGN